ncbi:hypothetical protein NQ314_005580 [Rhamnusium bicolor]|uniref:PiggyBac transposable element-derived protein domain-containing protein n=1 Tax=Rhamnusium bicolor TaxID=1586634 RepID=A0AAV8ZH02_9CUCU|nr:hypothetical protein NQ314_005580 [Rhamnusium bicolor]
MPTMSENFNSKEFTFQSSDNMLALKWCEKRDVYMISTVHDIDVVSTGKIDRTTRSVVMKPKCIVGYNASMGAVDKTDMLLSSVECFRKCIKWCKKKVPLANFQMEVIRGVLKNHHKGKLRCSGGRIAVENPLRLTARHFLSRVPSTEKRKVRQRKCIALNPRRIIEEKVPKGKIEKVIDMCVHLSY